ncbi:rRNA-processing protein EBP2 [Sporothrix bragantina]|uniref:rRNA-processing protein EBP2 n=1 Tax=Sporothrix bragantina TaxID=671064 RepID=A0ABP0AUL6_9PEZI
MGRSKLKVALAAHKGTDFQKLKEKKKYKAALKEKSKKAAGLEDDEDDEDEQGDEEEEDDDEDDEDEDEDEERAALIDDEASESDEDEDEDDEEELGADFVAAMDDSDDSDSDIEMEAKITRPKVDKKGLAEKKAEKKAKNDDDEDDEEEEDEDEQAWSDVDEEDRANLVVRQRQTINNTAALTASLLRIRTFAPTDKSVPFSLHQSVTGAVPTTSHPDGTPMDMSDDKVREQALYAQSLAAAIEARQRLRKEGVPFTRPTDYFAEMLKDDGHMTKVKAKLVEAATAAKASAEARKQRDLKKFGKKVQVEKMQERAKEKKDTLEKIKSLKRKRSELGTSSTHEADLFDVAVEKELAGGPGAKKGAAKGGRAGAPGAPNAKRQKKNEKYGFGGKKRHSKSGDAMSSGDLSGFNARKMKAGGSGRPVRGRPGQKSAGPRTAQRPGKARRKAAAGKR